MPDNVFPADIEETREKINSAFSSLTWDLSRALEAANLSGDQELIGLVSKLYFGTFEQMRPIGEHLEMQGWKPKVKKDSAPDLPSNAGN